MVTDWLKFLAYTPEQYAAGLSGKIFVDAMNRFDIPAVTAAGLHYIGVGRGPATS